MKIFKDKGYTYQKHISTGGEGEVHLIKSADKQFVAKIFPKLDQSSIDVLKAIQSLNVSGIPEIHEIFDYKEKTIVIREYVEGTTLYDEIRKNEFLSLKRAKTIILKICEILSKLHRSTPQPIIYRDLKPENIIITPDGDVKLIDFGIARYYKMDSTRDTVLAGTKGYTAPEVMAGMQSDVRSDVYSAGLLFYEMLTGKNLLIPPFQIRPVREANELLPEYLDTIIEKSTDLNQTKRYKTIEEFIQVIQNPDVKKKNTPISHKKLIGFIIGAIIVLIAAGGIWALTDIFAKKQNTHGLDGAPATDIKTQPSPAAPQALANQILEQTDIEDDYKLLLDLQFDDMDDFLWMELFNDNEYYNGGTEKSFADMTHDGVVNLDCEFSMKYKFGAGDFFHIRIKPGEAEQNGTLLLLCFVPKLGSEWSEASYEIKFDNKQVVAGEIRSDYGYYNRPAEGSPMLVNNYWLDVVMCLDDEGKTFRYLAFDVQDKSKVIYGGAAVFDSWQSCDYQIFIDLFYEYWQGELGVDMPQSQVEFIRQGSGDAKSYLEEYIEGYNANKDTINEFLETDIAFVGEERFTQHGY